MVELYDKQQPLSVWEMDCGTREKDIFLLPRRILVSYFRLFSRGLLVFLVWGLVGHPQHTHHQGGHSDLEINVDKREELTKWFVACPPTPPPGRGEFEAIVF